MTQQFDTQTDREAIADGGFFCHACLIGKPSGEQSPDSRYCQACHDFLLKEAGITGSRAAWLPRPSKDASTGISSDEKMVLVPQPIHQNLSTLQDANITVDIIKPVTPKITIGKRGPKHKALPEDIIRQLYAEGMRSRAIASSLRRVHGISISYKTIQRLLVRIAFI